MVLFGLFLFINLNGCNDQKKPPFKLNVKEVNVYNLLGLKIIHHGVFIASTIDNLKIKNVIVNKGNCKMDPYKKIKFPVKLKYGEVAKFIYFETCNIMRVDVITDKGKWGVEIE